ncbi:MAG: hypothetical protein MZV70_42780 [Desulfobacterales bacterium]|nr:hypothetical protein [Desulfobacterales bacterium]
MSSARPWGRPARRPRPAGRALLPTRRSTLKLTSGMAPRSALLAGRPGPTRDESTASRTLDGGAEPDHPGVLPERHRNGDRPRDSPVRTSTCSSTGQAVGTRCPGEIDRAVERPRGVDRRGGAMSPDIDVLRGKPEVGAHPPEMLRVGRQVIGHREPGSRIAGDAHVVVAGNGRAVLDIDAPAVLGLHLGRCEYPGGSRHQ